MSSTPDIAMMLYRAHYSLDTRLTAALEDYVGISLRHQCVLSKALTGEFTQGQLAEMAQLDKTTMVATIDELERLGFAERRPSSTDRRARIIKVTAEGERRAKDGQAMLEDTYREVLDELPARVRQGFVDGLTRLVDGPLAQPVACEKPPRRR